MNNDNKKLIDILNKNIEAGYDLRINDLSTSFVDNTIISDNYAIAVNLDGDIQITNQDLMELHFEDEYGTEYTIEFTIFKQIIY